MRLADYIIRQLERIGVDCIFMLPGGGAMYLNDAVTRSNLRSSICLHEQAAGIAAEAYGRFHTSQLGVAIVTSGPGSTNILTPVAGAYIESNPLLIISGQVKRADLNLNRRLRQSGVQEVDIISMVKEITKARILLDDPLRIKLELERCIQSALAGRRGPVWIDVPIDVQAYTLPQDYPDINIDYLSPCISHADDSCNYSEIARIIQRSFRPLLLVGQGCRFDGAVTVLQSFAESFEIPVISTFPAIDLFPYNHELYIGRPGSVSTRAANFAVQNCDLLISVGSSLNNVITAFNPRNFASKAYKIVVDIDYEEIKKNMFENVLEVVLDAKTFLKTLMDHRAVPFEDVKQLRSEWKAFTSSLKSQYSHEYRLHTSCSNNYLSHYELVDILSEHLPSDAKIVTGSSGLCVEIFYAYFRNKRDQKISITSGLGSMGFGLCAAVGACYANIGSRIFCVEGDGSLQQNIQELAVVSGERLPISLIVVNNGGYASIRNSQNTYFMGRFVGVDSESGLHLPSMEKLALAYSIEYISARTAEEFTAALNSTIRSVGPQIIEVFANPHEKLLPKVQAHVSVDGTITSMPIEDMSPLLSLDELNRALKYSAISAQSYAARGVSSR